MANLFVSYSHISNYGQQFGNDIIEAEEPKTAEDIFTIERDITKTQGGGNTTVLFWKIMHD